MTPDIPQSQLTRFAVYNSAAGFVSFFVFFDSSVPARTILTSGTISPSRHNGEPQSGQNQNVTACPLSAFVEYDFGVPLTWNRAASTMMLVLKTEPDAF